MSRGTVILLLPPYDGEPLGPPAGLLAIAAPVRDAGFRVRLIDAAVESDWLAAVEREATDAVCLGVSLLTGPTIRPAVQAAHAAKRIRADLPVVFGGWHPTLEPEGTLAEPSIDVVVKHQGEVAFLEVLERIEAGRSLDGLAGVCWRDAGGDVRLNPDRPMARMDESPTPAYDLVDFDAYERAGAGRKLPYATSVGCPYTCAYCTDMVFYNRRFNPYEAERTVREVSDLVRRHRIDEVALLDSNFLVNVRRATAIARGFLETAVRFRWTFQASTDLLCRMPDEDVRLLAEAGVRHIGFGTESASEPVLKAMRKSHQKIADMHEAARKTAQAGIRATYNLIFGFPGETEADRAETLRVMAEIAGRYDHVTFSANVFTPYPGIPIWPQLRELGVPEPRTLEEWADVALGANRLPWLSGEPLERLDRILGRLAEGNDYARRARRAETAAERKLWRKRRRNVFRRLSAGDDSPPPESRSARHSLLTGESLEPRSGLRHC